VLIVAVLALGAVPLLAGCGSSKSSSSSTGSSGSGGGGGGKKTIAGVQANDHGTKSVAGTKTEVELDDFYFKPTVLEGTPGEKVKLELKNEGKVEHTFTIDAQNIDQDLQPGDEAEVTVTIPKSGSVSFYCKFHKSSGMAGALAVAGGSGGMTGTGNGTTTNSGGGGGGGY
jgi:plastocyanin